MCPDAGISKTRRKKGSGASTGKLHCVALVLSHIRLSETPWTVAHQAPPSMGFPRQEYWSGLPFPSPVHESEKWKWSPSVVSNSSWPPWTVAHQAPLSMGFLRKEHWNGLPFPSPGDFPDPGIEPRSPALQADSLLWHYLYFPHL